MIGIGLNIGNRVMGGFDSSASAFFAATGITGTTEQQAVNTLVTSLKSAGLWSKMKAVYPFVTDNRNLLSYTNNWTNAIWQGSSVTTGQADPFGGTNAILCSVEKWQSFSYTTLTQYTISIYAKANISSIFTLGSDSTPNYYSTFNLSTQTVVNSTGYSGSITSIGNGWYRCSVTWTKDSGGALTQPFYDFKPTGGSMYFYGPQLELGSSATTYQTIATTQQSYISNQFKYNLVNPVDSDAAFRGVFNGGWTFSNQGATPNGTNGYMDTKFVPNTNLTINDQSYSIYSRSNTAAGAKRELALSSSGEVGVLARYTGDLFYPIIGGGVYPNVSNTDSRGHYIANRTDATNIKGYKNGSLVLTYPQTPNLPTLYTVALSAKNVSGIFSEYSDRQLAFSHLGQGLTDTEATALYNAVNQFQVSLSRNV